MPFYGRLATDSETTRAETPAVSVPFARHRPRTAKAVPQVAGYAGSCAIATGRALRWRFVGPSAIAGLSGVLHETGAMRSKLTSDTEADAERRSTHDGQVAGQAFCRPLHSAQSTA